MTKATSYLGVGVPAGTDTQTLRYNGTTLEATSGMVVDASGNATATGALTSQGGEGVVSASQSSFTSADMRIRGGTSATSNLYMGTTANDFTGVISYDHLANSMAFTVNSASRMTITSAGKVTIANSAVAGTQTANATGSTTLDFATYQNFVLTLTGNVTLDNPTTEAVGQSGFITFIQDATGSRTVSLGTDYETAGGAGLTLSTAANTTDLVPYIVTATGRILLGAPQLAFS